MGTPAVTSGSAVTRVAQLTIKNFLSDYLERNQPIIVTGAMRNWKALKKWTPNHLATRFGNEQVQVYGDLFRLTNITSLSEYLNKYFGRGGMARDSRGVVPYVRWYSHLIGNEGVPWADDVFRQIKDDR